MAGPQNSYVMNGDGSGGNYNPQMHMRGPPGGADQFSNGPPVYPNQSPQLMRHPSGPQMMNMTGSNQFGTGNVSTLT